MLQLTPFVMDPLVMAYITLDLFAALLVTKLFVQRVGGFAVDDPVGMFISVAVFIISFVFAPIVLLGLIVFYNFPKKG